MSEHTYLAALEDILEYGTYKEDRTGTGTYSLHGLQMRYDLRQGFPLFTTKKVFLRGIIHELLWFIKGSTNAIPLQQEGVHIWDEWAAKDGSLGPIYGKQWRRWSTFEKIHPAPRCNVYTEGKSIDQLQGVIDGLKKDPFGRRHIVSAWNPADIPDMALPPCHTMFQFIAAPIKWQDRIGIYVARMHKDLSDYTREEQDKIMDDVGIPKFYLDCVLYQRSGDMFLGVPFNVASYSLLLMMVAQLTNMEPREFIHHITDAHVYANHVEQVKEQIARVPRKLPRMTIAHRASIDDFLYEDFALFDYEPYPAIKAPVAV